MKTTSHPNFPNRCGPRIMPSEVNGLHDEGLHRLARTPRPTVEDDLPAIEHLSFDSWMSGGGLRPHQT